MFSIPTVRLVGFALLVAPLVAAETDETDIERQLRRFVEVFSVVEQQAADPVEPGVAFYTGAIPGMLKRLDPHSVFFDPMQFLQLQELQKSTRKGFGTVVSLLPGRVIILQTMPGTPSARSGRGRAVSPEAISGPSMLSGSTC